MLAGIRGVREVVLPQTGRRFRFTHPDEYAAVITRFVDESVSVDSRT